MSEGQRKSDTGLAMLSQALDLLLAFAESGELAPRDLLQRLDLPRTSLHRYLNLLVEEQFLERLPSRRYRLGLRVLELSRSLRRETHWVELSMPVLRRLAAEMDETVLLTAVQDGEVVCLERVGGRGGLAISYRKAGRFPLHAGAPSKVLLAYQSPEVVEQVLAQPLKAFTPGTITDLQALRDELQRISSAGISVALGEVDQGVCGVGAPIFDPFGQVAAAVTIAMPAARFHADRLEPVAAAVRSAAEEISGFIC